MSILSALRSFGLQTKSQPPTDEILEKDLEYRSGQQYELENPDSLLRNLGAQLTIYDKMMRDDRIRMSIELKKRVVLSYNYEVMPASDEEQDIEIATFVEDALATKQDCYYNQSLGYSFDGVLFQLLDAMIYGFRVAEKRWEVRDGKVTLKDLYFAHPMYFDYCYDKFGNLDSLHIGRYQGFDTKIEGKDKILEKFLIVTYPVQTNNNFYGHSDLESVFSKYRSKQHIQKMRDIKLEKWGAPVPNVIYDASRTSAAEKANIETMLKNWQEGTYFLTPGKLDAAGQLIGKIKIDLIENSSTAFPAFESAIDQLDKQITRAILFPDKLGFSESPGGSYNQSEIQLDVFTAVISSIHRWLEGAINPVIKQLVDYNFSTDVYPYLKFEDAAETIKPDALKTLIDSGVIDKREKWIRRYIGVPEISQEERDAIDEQKANEPKPPVFGLPQGLRPEADEEGEKVSPEPAEELARKTPPIDAKKISTRMDSLTEAFQDDYLDMMEGEVKYLISQIEKKKIIENKDLKTLENLQLHKGNIKSLFANYFRLMYVEGKVSAIESVQARRPVEMAAEFTEEFDAVKEWKRLKKYGKLGEATKKDKEKMKLIEQVAYAEAGTENDRLITAAERIVNQGFRENLAVSDIVKKLNLKLGEELPVRAEVVARTQMATNFNEGWMNEYRSGELADVIVAYSYSAIMDDSTSEFCAAHDGQVIAADDPQLDKITPPNHPNCRSILIPIFKGDVDEPNSYYKGWETDKEKFPKFGSGVNADGQKFDMNNEKFSEPAKGFGR